MRNQSPESNIKHQQIQKENTVGKGPPKKVFCFVLVFETLSVKQVIQYNILTVNKEEKMTWERKRKTDRLWQRNTASQL